MCIFVEVENIPKKYFRLHYMTIFFYTCIYNEHISKSGKFSLDSTVF